MRLLRGHPVFRRFFVAAFITEAGDQVHRIALMIYVFQRTGSSSAVALVMAAQILVNILIAPFLSAWAEARERRSLLVATQVAQGFLVLLIPWLGMGSLVVLWVLVFLIQIFQSLEYPLIAAVTPELVPEEHLDEANGLIAFTKRFAEVAVTGLAGLLVAVVGPVFAFYLDSASFFVTAGLLLGLPRILPQGGQNGGYLERVVEGFGHILRTPVLRRSIGALAVAALFGSVEKVLGVALAEGVLRVGSKGYGAIEMSLALGAVVGTLVVAAATRRLGREKVFVWSLVFFGAALLSVGAYPVFLWVLAAYFLTGLFNYGFLVPLRGVLQTHTPKPLITRVFGAVGATSQSAVLAGTLGGGLVADAVGVPITYMAAGFGVALVGLYLAATGGVAASPGAASRRPRWRGR